MSNAGSATQAATPPGGSSANEMAVDRTRMAHERTLMAWVRTATSLISFGFSIYKFADILEGKAEGTGFSHRRRTVRG